MVKRFLVIDDEDSDLKDIDIESGPIYVPTRTPPVASPDDYFGHFIKGENNAWKVLQGPWKLYDGLVPVELAGSVPEEFRVAITISPTQGHAVLEGSVFVNDEELEFTEATRLTNIETLTAVLEILTEGLDCNILVECISVYGEPLFHEVLEPIEVVVFPKTRIMKDPSGSGYMETSYDVYSEALLKIGDKIRYPDPFQGTDIEMYVKDVSAAVDLEDNSIPFRTLYCE